MSTTTIAPAEERVATGAQLLDRLEPGWAKMLDAELLDISCGESCVLGQVYGGYADGMITLFGDDYANSHAETIGVRHGFYHSGDDVYGQTLEDLWLAEVATRTEAA